MRTLRGEGRGGLGDPRIVGGDSGGNGYEIVTVRRGRLTGRR